MLGAWLALIRYIIYTIPMLKDKKQRNKYAHEYTKNNYQRYVFFLDKQKDVDLINKLNSIKRKTEYIKTLLYNDNPDITPEQETT